MTAAMDFGGKRAGGPAVRGLVSFAYATLFLLIVGLGGLSTVISLAGAVVTPGRLVVASYHKPVQHLKGGTVDTLFVENGDEVSAGQMLVRLDETQTRANLEIVSQRLNELKVRSARLLAEEGGLSAIEFPQDIAAKAKQDPEFAKLVSGEEGLFDARRLSQSRRKDQLTERVLQYRKQIDGLQAQIEGKRQEIALIREEMSGVRELVEKELLSKTRLTELQRQEAQLQGQLGGLVSSIAETEGRITETELQKLQVDDDIRSQASSDLRDAQAQIAEYEERRVAAEDELAHVEIRAPEDGVVQELSVHAAGAVVGAGTPIMTIVPVKDNLVAEVKIAPQDIDQIAIGQKAVLRLSALNQRTTPEIAGEVVHVSADLTQDARTGESFFLARVAPDKDDLEKLVMVKLLPGMPAEVFIQTEPRTILSYLLKPAMDQVNRAFREE